MKPIEFPEMTAVAAKDQPQYEPLPMFRDPVNTVSCWKMTLWERVRFLFSGIIWLVVKDFGGPIAPVLLTTERPFLRVDPEERNVRPVVVRLERTCQACPSQWEGLTADSRQIYIRYRHGVLTVNIGRIGHFGEYEAIRGRRIFEDDDKTGGGDMADRAMMTATESVLDWSPFQPLFENA